MDVMTLAGKLARLIDEKGLKVTAEDLTQFEGVGDAKATLILAAIEFARRRIKPEGVKIKTPADSPAPRPALRRPEAGAFYLRHDQRSERDFEHPSRFDWFD